MTDYVFFRKFIEGNLSPAHRRTPVAVRMMAGFFRRGRIGCPKEDREELAKIVLEVARGMGVDV